MEFTPPRLQTLPSFNTPILNMTSRLGVHRQRKSWLRLWTHTSTQTHGLQRMNTGESCQWDSKSTEPAKILEHFTTRRNRDGYKPQADAAAARTRLQNVRRWTIKDTDVSDNSRTTGILRKCSNVRQSDVLLSGRKMRSNDDGKQRQTDCLLI